MRTLLEQTFDERKQFALTEVQHIAEWSDIHSTDDFEMEENKGGSFSFRWWLDGLTNIIYRLSKKSNPDDYPILFRIYGAGRTCMAIIP